MVVAWSRKSCLGPTETLCFVCIILFKDGGRRVSARAYLFVSDIKSRELGGGTSSRLLYVTPRIETFSLDLQGAAKN